MAREFRGVWIATVANIDWPSRPGLRPATQRAELLALLDRAVELRLNAVILQVRPAADALYPSPHEPWSEYLTGTMGEPPEPFYDPLAFAIREAHRRGLELHAWFNPFRARHSTGRAAAAASHIGRMHPELVREYGDQLWMDPGEERVRRHSLRVILDVVRRYDVDGVHLDDYFYPYPVRDSAGRRIDFPDDASWTRYRSEGGTLGRDGWRRRNVNRFVERLYHVVEREKPWVKVGISPFGIWRPGRPEQIRGFDAYAELYADSRKWLRNGWVDYLAPQLYWRIDPPEQSYPVLLDWWVAQNDAAPPRHIWPGLIPNRWPAAEIAGQIRITREEPGAGGNVLFSGRSLLANRGGIADRLAAGPYRRAALVPASSWLDDGAPGRPRAALRRDGGAGQLTMEPTGEAGVFLWIVRARYEEGWTTELVPGERRAYRVVRGGETPTAVRVSGVDRAGNQGPAVRVAPQPDSTATASP